MNTYKRKQKRNRAALLAGSMSVAAMLFAAAVPAAPASAAAMSESFAALDGLKRVEQLDLETALQLVLEDSGNIMLLELQAEALESKRQQLNDQANSLEQMPVQLPDTQEELIGDADPTPDQALWLGSMIATNTVLNQSIIATNMTIEAQRKELDQTVRQLYTDRQNTLLGIEEAKEGAKLQVTSQYVQLLALDKQIELAESYLAVLESDLSRAKTLQKLGKASAKQVSDAERPIREQKEQLEALNDGYRAALIQFSFDLGIEYNPELKLAEPDVEPEPVVRADTETLLAESFELKRQWNDVELAVWQKNRTGDSSEDGERYLDATVDIAQEQAELAKLELAKSIDRTYTDAEQAYRDYEAALQDKADAEADVRAATVQYENGLLTAFDLSKLKFALQQAETAVATAKLQYAAQMSRVEAMNAGLIVA
ncbi:TolC family protein [Paenibacillus thailandensis]|uniref:TolC family protein n=1 Tax=Paenibacillus thailandensis TaxID=393250 RepID=A0ABW5QX12_9BACL